MIKSFACKDTERIWKGIKSKKWNYPIANQGLRKLMMINAAEDINDLRIPPSNQLHKLKGDLNDYWAVRINIQWRIIFIWENNHAFNVQIIDYH